jgi:probable HAF family extracellular repeat protein
MRNHDRRRIAVLGTALAMTLSAAASAQAPIAAATTTPQIVALPTLAAGATSNAADINDRGFITGSSTTAEGNMHAVRWDPSGRITDLGTLPGELDSIAMAINDAGEVCGYTSPMGLAHPVRWDANGHITALDLLPGYSRSSTVGINDDGFVVGTSFSAEPAVNRRAVRWGPDGHVAALDMLDGGNSDAVDINDRGEVIGHAETASGIHAVRWDRQGRVTDLGARPGWVTTVVRDINNRGEVAGSSDLSGAVRWDSQGRVTVLADVPIAVGINDHGTTIGNDQTAYGRAVRWTRAGQATVLDGPSGRLNTVAEAINERGEVTGYASTPEIYPHAVRWNHQGVVTDLGVLPGHLQSIAWDINARGDIVGYSTDYGASYRAVVWRT